jgi:putative addiction module component (TIGR02574 family)
MTVEAKKVLAKALTLLPVERAELVEQILASFEFPSRGEVDALWAKETESRIDAYDQKKLKATPASKVFDKIDKRSTR